MDALDSVWQVFILSLLAGALIGALIYRIVDPSAKQLQQLKSERDSANQELESYQAGVSQHFDKTSALVNDLTQNYVKVYQHLAEGAQTLGAGKSFNNLLEQNQGKVSLAVEDSSIVNEVDQDAESASDNINRAEEVVAKDEANDALQDSAMDVDSVEGKNKENLSS